MFNLCKLRFYGLAIKSTFVGLADFLVFKTCILNLVVCYSNQSKGIHQQIHSRKVDA